MEEIKTVARSASPRVQLAALLRENPAAANAVAFAALSGGGYAALRLMGLLFRLLGVD